MFLLEWLEYAVSWVLVKFHSLFTTLGFPSDSGVAWGMAIVCLVIVIRICLIPLFVKQIKAQRGLQTIQPQMKEIQKKYAGDRERQSQEMTQHLARPAAVAGRRRGPLRCASWDAEHQVAVVFGGEGSREGTLVYDPYTNTWTRMKPDVRARSSAAAATWPTTPPASSTSSSARSSATTRTPGPTTSAGTSGAT